MHQMTLIANLLLSELLSKTEHVRIFKSRHEEVHVRQPFWI